MTSQVNSPYFEIDLPEDRGCRPPENAPTDYCQKLKSGIARLQSAILAQYEEAFPAEREWIARVVREAEKAAWATPFPSLFFPVLAHLQVNQRMPPA